MNEKICRGCGKSKNLDDKRIEQINSTDKIEIFIDGKKTVFVRDGKKECTCNEKLEGEPIIITAKEAKIILKHLSPDFFDEFILYKKLTRE